MTQIEPGELVITKKLFPAVCASTWPANEALHCRSPTRPRGLESALAIPVFNRKDTALNFGPVCMFRGIHSRCGRGVLALIRKTDLKRDADCTAEEHLFELRTEPT